MIVPSRMNGYRSEYISGRSLPRPTALSARVSIVRILCLSSFESVMDTCVTRNCADRERKIRDEDEIKLIRHFSPVSCAKEWNMERGIEVELCQRKARGEEWSGLGCRGSSLG